MANDLVQRGVAAIVTPSGPATSAAKAATTSVPIVFMTGFDPVASGFVASLNDPGGNVTGVFILNPDLLFKRTEVLHELAPAVKSFALFYTRTGDKAEEPFYTELQRAAEARGVTMRLYSVSQTAESEETFARAVDEGAGAILVNNHPVFLNNRELMTALAARHRLPAMYPLRQFVADGGLASYGANPADAFRLVGDYVARILRGEKPAKLPVQQMTRIELVVNTRTAKALGITIPLTVLALADEIVE